MKRDRLIAVSDSIAASVKFPIQIGALRDSSESELTWVDEARPALRRHERVVLTGDILHQSDLMRSISDLKTEYRSARFALCLHWSQALNSSLSVGIRLNVEAVYVVIDEELSASQVRLIEQNWHAHWVLLASSEVNWSKWIPTALFPEKQGVLLVLAPEVSAAKNGSKFLSADELRVVIAQFTFEHPLIHIAPVPAEWFIATETGPWKAKNRRPELSRVLFDNRSPDISTTAKFVSVIVPFLDRGNGEATGNLNRCFVSIEKTFPDPRSREIILAVDQAVEGNFKHFEFPGPSFLDGPLQNVAIVHVPRFGSGNDWRAGFVRNVAEEISSARDESFLLFVDADVEITEPTCVRDATSDRGFDILQPADDPSKIIAVRRGLFHRIGGFAEAFSSYGCEGHFVIWKARAAGAPVGQIPTRAIEHLHSATEDDDLIFKTARLGQAASLMYRMTLDPRVHQHFYVSLGDHIWSRALLKRVAANWLGRFAMGFCVFMLTLVQTESPLRYLRSFYDVVIWKLKRPVLWIRANSRKLRHQWNEIEWRYPEFVTDGKWREIRAHRFKWRAITGSTLGLFKLLAVICSRRITSPAHRIIGEFGWKIPVVLERALGIFLKYRATLHTATVGRLRAQSWIFTEPTAWFSLNMPLFYRFVWKPLLRIRYFLEYHLSVRWRKS